MFAWVHSRAPKCRRVHAVSGGFTEALLAVVAFILVCVRSLGRTLRSSGSFEFATVNSCAARGCRDYSCSRKFALALLKVAGYIQFRVG